MAKEKNFTVLDSETGLEKEYWEIDIGEIILEKLQQKEQSESKESDTIKPPTF